jgi:hypothetical protein
MTSKEKALELWWKYYSRIEHTLSEEYSPHEKDITKKLAIAAVDEILSVIWNNPEDVDYWSQVVNEIKNL